MEIGMKNNIDMETIMICAVMAVTGAFGIVAGGAAFLGIRFRECNTAVLTGICCSLSGILWGVLLIVNSNGKSGQIRSKNA